MSAREPSHAVIGATPSALPPRGPLAEVSELRRLLDEGAVVGEMRQGARRFWTGREEKLLRERYPTEGLAGCLPLLPGRSASSIYQRAGALGLRSPSTPPTKRERWTTNDAIDSVIRRAYQTTPTKGDIQRCARTVGRPRWWVSKRAGRLGLATPRFSGLRWTERENELIETRAHQHLRTVRLALRREGFDRTETAIAVQLKRLGASRRDDPDHFTGRGLAAIMGIDAKGVSAWIIKGWLKAKRRGTERTDAQGGDEWWIHRRDVRQFIIENAAAVDIRKVDKFWFVELLTSRD